MAGRSSLLLLCLVASSMSFPRVTLGQSTGPVVGMAPKTTALERPLEVLPAESRSREPRAATLASNKAQQLRATGGFLLVCGGLLVAMWLMRGNRPANQLLPTPVAEVLGKVPFPGRPPLHLLRFGTKLVLVSTHGTQLQTIAEVTDPAEVARLTDMCRTSRGTRDLLADEEWSQRFAESDLVMGERVR